MSQLPSQTFCILPWIHLYSSEEGHIFPCCQARDVSVRADDENGQPYQIGGADPLLVWNAENRKKMRSQFLSGQRPAACIRCFSHEDAGGVSYRQRVNQDFSASLRDIEELRGINGQIPFDVRFLDLRLGNLCNLRCKMCTPISSRQILGDYKEIYGVDITKPQWHSLRALDWFKKKEFWDALPTFLPSLERLHFAGGEPLIIPESFEFLARLVQMGCTKNITLSYNTNLTVLPQRALELWPHFKEVHLLCSIDGVGRLNDYIRYPSRWNEIEKNLRILDSAAADYNCSHISVHSTVQVYNVFRIGEIVDFLATFRNIVPYPDLSALHGPEQFNIQILPKEIKQKAEAALRAVIPQDLSSNLARSFEAGLLAVIGHMHATELASYLPVFLNASRAYDRIRGESMNEILPELSTLVL